MDTIIAPTMQPKCQPARNVLDEVDDGLAIAYTRLELPGFKWVVARMLMLLRFSRFLLLALLDTQAAPCVSGSPSR